MNLLQRSQQVHERKCFLSYRRSEEEQMLLYISFIVRIQVTQKIKREWNILYF